MVFSANFYQMTFPNYQSKGGKNKKQKQYFIIAMGRYFSLQETNLKTNFRF